MVVELVISGASLAITLFGIVQKTIKDKRVIREADMKRLIDLRTEVKHNQEIVGYLAKFDTSSRAVYDPAIRKLIIALQFKELQKARNDFNRFLGKDLTKVSKKGSTKTDPLQIFWAITDTAKKINDLNSRLTLIPTKPTPKAPRILLGRRLPALAKRLEFIDQTLSIIPLSKKPKTETKAAKQNKRN
jgi:hypothetical protein